MVDQIPVMPVNGAAIRPPKSMSVAMTPAAIRTVGVSIGGSWGRLLRGLRDCRTVGLDHDRPSGALVTGAREAAGRCGAARPSRRVLRTGAPIAQQRERVEASRMTVAPVR